MRKYNNFEYIERCSEIHNNKYDYSLTNYEGSNKKVKIVCKEHGEFSQLAFCHLKGQSCPMCINEYKRKGIYDFISSCESIHDNKYDYSLVSFTNRKEKVKIVCKEHGIFSQRASDHLSGSGCPICFRCKRKMTHDEFIEKSVRLHGDKYEYIEEYKESHSVIKIKCNTHGEFYQMPYAHLKGQGCYKCSFRCYDKDTFIIQSNIIHNNSFNYDMVSYVNNRTKVEILCSKHGLFNMTPNAHLRGQSCPLCKRNISKGETDWLTSLSIENEHRHKTIYIGEKRYFVDAIVGNTIYEFYGDYWHGNPNIYRYYDINVINNINFGRLYEKTIEREEILKKNGYNIISIWESDFIKQKI